MTAKLDQDLIDHACGQLHKVARRLVQFEGLGPASAARKAIRETKSLFPSDWRLAVQGDDDEEFVEVWEVEHKRSIPCARVSREIALEQTSAALKSRRSKTSRAKIKLPTHTAPRHALNDAARKTPPHWAWAYHVAPKSALPAIKSGGLRPHWHAHVEDAPVIFVEPDREGVAPYYEPRNTIVLRFRTPGFGTTEDGESVIYGSSQRPGAPPDAPLVGRAGEEGVIPPKRLQVEHDGKFAWLI